MGNGFFMLTRKKWVQYIAWGIITMAGCPHIHAENTQSSYEENASEKDERTQRLEKELQELKSRLAHIENQLKEENDLKSSKKISSEQTSLEPMPSEDVFQAGPVEENAFFVEEKFVPEKPVFTEDVSANKSFISEQPLSQSQNIEWRQGPLPEESRKAILQKKETPATMQEVRKFLENGQTEKAKKILQHMLEKTSDPEACYLLGIIALWSDKTYNKAYRLFVSAYSFSQRAPTYAFLGATCLVRMAEALFLQGKKKEAQKILLHYHKKSEALRQKDLHSEEQNALLALDEEAKALEKE